MAMLSCHIHRHCIKMARKTLEAHKLFCYFLAFEVLALSPCTLSLMEIGPTRGREKGGGRWNSHAEEEGTRELWREKLERTDADGVAAISTPSLSHALGGSGMQGRTR